MKIVIVNKTDAQGGAAIAAKRLKEALSKNGEEPVMLVQKKHTQDENTFTTKKGLAAKYFEFALFVIERLYFYFSEKSKAVRFAFSPAVSGENITRNQWIRNADIIHIHWFNQGFLSLKNVKQILKLNKPVVWTLHDMWAFTGGCHYSGTCENYRQYCGNCSFVKHPGNQDLSSKIWKRKEKIFKKANIRIVTCSEWLAHKARQSSLLQRFTISSIPNPIDTDLYFPKSKADIRNKLNLPLNKKLILFGSANIMDQRKGLNYLLQALQKLKDENALIAENIEIVLFGKSDADFISQIPFNVYDMGMIKGDSNIIDIYNAADIFVLPSLEDNLPNTIMESMACGTPVLAFETGGIPEMIDHKINGYLAKYKSVDDLKDGILYLTSYCDLAELSKAAVAKVYKEYKQSVVAERYKAVYQSLLEDKQKRPF